MMETQIKTNSRAHILVQATIYRNFYENTGTGALSYDQQIKNNKIVLYKKRKVLTITWNIRLRIGVKVICIAISYMFGSCSMIDKWIESLKVVYERVYLPLCEVADTPFHIQGYELFYHDILYLSVNI